LIFLATDATEPLYPKFEKTQKFLRKLNLHFILRRNPIETKK